VQIQQPLKKDERNPNDRFGKHGFGKGDRTGGKMFVGPTGFWQFLPIQ